MSPAVWTNNPPPGGWVPGGITADGSRCWRRMENAMHNKYWSSRRVINEPWLGGREKGRWRLVRSGFNPEHVELFSPSPTLGHAQTTRSDPGRWDYRSTNTDAAHTQVQTKAIKHTLTRTHTYTRHNQLHAGDKNQCTNTEEPPPLASILHNDTLTFQTHSTHSREKKKRKMTSGFTGWRRITRWLLLIKWKSRKIVLGGTNNWVRAIEGHRRLQLLRLNTAKSFTPTAPTQHLLSSGIMKTVVMSRISVNITS